MKYFYKLTPNNKNKFYQHPNYLFYSSEPKSKWEDDTLVTWSAPRFTHTACYHSLQWVLTNDVIKSLKRISEKEAFIMSI